MKGWYLSQYFVQTSQMDKMYPSVFTKYEFAHYYMQKPTTKAKNVNHDELFDNSCFDYKRLDVKKDHCRTLVVSCDNQLVLLQDFNSEDLSSLRKSSVPVAKRLVDFFKFVRDEYYTRVCATNVFLERFSGLLSRDSSYFKDTRNRNIVLHNIIVEDDDIHVQFLMILNLRAAIERLHFDIYHSMHVINEPRYMSSVNRAFIDKWVACCKKSFIGKFAFDIHIPEFVCYSSLPYIDVEGHITNYSINKLQDKLKFIASIKDVKVFSPQSNLVNFRIEMSGYVIEKFNRNIV